MKMSREKLPTKKSKRRKPNEQNSHTAAGRAPAAAISGTVTYVDDMGQIGVDWDNGSGLSLVPGEDSFSKLAGPEKTKSNHGMER